jgi:LmbE family N-acetylglucosaminyl deacetylase
VLIAAHPDDEAIGAGARLRCFGAIVHVTDGAPRSGADARGHGFPSVEAYARARRSEALAAAGCAGVDPSRVLALGFHDQEASLRLASLAERIASLLRELDAEAVVTHPYEGGHPDHDATAFAARAACTMLERCGLRSPVVLEMTSYHAGPGRLRTGEFLADRGAGGERVCPLTAAQRELKRRVLACYRTQAGVLRPFGLEAERFREAPRYDFARPAHEGPLFYEGFDWGMRGDRFRALARAALAELGPERRPWE